MLVLKFHGDKNSQNYQDFSIEAWAMVRIERNNLLKKADLLLSTASDNGIDTTPFRQYRQALRDIPQTFTNAQDVVWPTKPTLSQVSA